MKRTLLAIMMAFVLLGPAGCSQSLTQPHLLCTSYGEWSFGPQPGNECPRGQMTPVTPLGNKKGGHHESP